MKYTINYLRQLLTDNNITGYNSRTPKLVLLSLLFNADVLTPEDILPTKKPIDQEYERLRTLRANPKKVTYTDAETGEVITYDSVYKARKARKRSDAKK